MRGDPYKQGIHLLMLMYQIETELANAVQFHGHVVNHAAIAQHNPNHPHAQPHQINMLAQDIADERERLRKYVSAF